MATPDERVKQPVDTAPVAPAFVPATEPAPTPTPTPVHESSSEPVVDLPWHEDSDQKSEPEPALESSAAAFGLSRHEHKGSESAVVSPNQDPEIRVPLSSEDSGVDTRTDDAGIAGTDSSAQAPSLGAEYFTDLLTQAGLDGMALSIARQGELVSISNGCLTLRLPPDNQSLFMEHHQQEMLQKLSSVLAEPAQRLVIDWNAAQGMTPNDVLQQREQAALVKAQMDFQSEPTVNWLQSQFDATIDSIPSNLGANNVWQHEHARLNGPNAANAGKAQRTARSSAQT